MGFLFYKNCLYIVLRGAFCSNKYLIKSLYEQQNNLRFAFCLGNE